MPVPYVLLHLFLTAALIFAAKRLPPKRGVQTAFYAVVLTIVGASIVIERRQTLAWSALAWGWQDLVFVSNLTLEGVAVLCVLLIKSASDRPGRLRAGFLSCVAYSVALWSYAWYFLAPPPGINGKVDSKGFCLQTSKESCSAAASVMLLHANGIDSTEAEMADLCMTRPGIGTSPFGMFRGLALKSHAHRMNPVASNVHNIAGLGKLNRPAIISVGLSSSCPPEIEERMMGYGWEPGRYHAVTVMAADTHGQWLDVADPSYGKERWPAKDIEYIWDGRALYLVNDKQN